MKVSEVKQWVANTVEFEDEDYLYLRLSSDTHAIWYELSGDQDSWVWVEDTRELEDAWFSRGGIPFEDIQAFGG